MSATAVFGKSTFYHPRAQRRPHHHTLSPESGHYLPPSVPLDGRSAPVWGDLPIKNEHRCHARDEDWLIAGVAPAGCFTADVSVFLAHLLRSRFVM